MKKFIHISIIFALLLALLPAVASAHTGDAPYVVDLLAGQNEDVGDVSVWNDAGNLYVKYELSGNWCLLETHVAVESSAAEIPQTKKNNPIPGQFEYSESYANPPCVQSPEPYVIPLDWDYGEDVFIAAHASVAKPEEGCYEQVWQIGDVEEINTEKGWLENYADEFNWGDPAGPTTMGPSLAQEKPAFTNPFIVGGTPVNEFPFNSNASTQYNYATDFDVQWDGNLPFGGRLTVSWSPGQVGNEQKVVSGDFSTATFDAIGTPSPGEGYFIDKYPLVEHTVLVNPLPFGTHEINFKHTTGDGTFWDWIRLDKVCEQDETGWGDGEDFGGKNWGMYIEYTIQAPPPPVCPELDGESENIEVLNTIPADIRVGALENDAKVRVWKEFEGSLTADLVYDLDEGRSARTNGPNPSELVIPSGEDVCVYYVHLDNVGPSNTVQHTGFLEFAADISGLIISGGDLGTFAGKDLMFAADGSVGDLGTTYPTLAEPDYWRGFDVNYGGNLDEAVFTGSRVDFTMWVVNAHDSFRVILPLVP